MQKKIIALAVAGLVSGAAFAQSNVTVFGIMDIGYQYSWSANVSGTKSQSQIKAGGQDGSRFGFRGTEDLGNGLKANFEMAAGYNGDTGANSGTLMSEGAWVGLSGDKWGSVKGGYFGSFIDDATGVDVTGRIGVASSGLIGTGKYTNFVAYYSPVFSGFQFKAGFSTNAIGQDKSMAPIAPTIANAQSGLNIRTYTVAADYKNGGLDVRAAYAAYDPVDVNYTSNNTLVKTDAGDEWLIGAGYDFKVAAVSLMYQSQKNAQVGTNVGLANFNGQGDMSTLGATTAGAAAIDKRDFWAIGVKVPFGAKDVVGLGYGQVKNKYYSGLGLDDDKAHKFGVSYQHMLSKRTNVYALYGNVSSDDINTSTTNYGKAYAIDGAYRNAFNVGIRHLF